MGFLARRHLPEQVGIGDVDDVAVVVLAHGDLAGAALGDDRGLFLGGDLGGHLHGGRGKLSLFAPLTHPKKPGDRRKRQQDKLDQCLQPLDGVRVGADECQQRWQPPAGGQQEHEQDEG